MANQINIVIQASDQASPALKKVQGSLRQTSGTADQQSSLIKRLSDNWQTFAGISVASGVALRGLFGQMNHAIGSANRLQAALTGLSSIAKAFNQDADEATQSARDLASDGLMTVADSATGLKNLLAAGFGLDQAVTLMKRFKDSAAFGRQASLSFGDAITSATEGIKNGNSILVDNAGVTKNLSMMLTDAGYSAQDLMKASSDAGVRQAIFSGIVKETNAQLGNAALLTDSAAGKQAQMAAQTEILYQNLGVALQPALLMFLQTVTPIIQHVSEWIQRNQGLASGIIIATGVLLTLSAAVSAFAPLIKAATVLASVFGPTVVGSVGKARAAFVALRALMAVPMVMPAIVITAALGAIQQVANKFSALYDQIHQNEANIKQTQEDIATIKKVNANYKAGKISRSTMLEQLRILNGHAIGTSYSPGGLRWVGENGPELMNVPQGAQVIPHYKATQVTGGGDTNIYENGTYIFQTAEAVNAHVANRDKLQRLAARGMA